MKNQIKHPFGNLRVTMFTHKETDLDGVKATVLPGKLQQRHQRLQ